MDMTNDGRGAGRAEAVFPILQQRTVPPSTPISDTQRSVWETCRLERISKGSNDRDFPPYKRRLFSIPVYKGRIVLILLWRDIRGGDAAIHQ